MKIEGISARETERAPAQRWVAGRGRVLLDGGDRPCLRDGLSRLAYERCVPLGASIELTVKCNLRCAHCYNLDRSVSAETERLSAELRPAEVKALIDELAEAGSLFLSLTGGEPLLNPDICDYIRHACERRFVVKVKTNGTLLTPERVSALKEAGALGVDVSIYGASAEVHDSFTTVEGSFERTLEGARNAQRGGLDVCFGYTIHRDTSEEVQRLTALADELDVSIVIDTQIRPRHDGTHDPETHRLDRETLLRLYEGPIRDVLPEPDFSPDRKMQCNCARNVVGIASTGDVYPCIAAPISAGNIRERSFSEIWRSSPLLEWIRGLGFEDFQSCVSCPDRPYCRRSSGYVYSATGNYTGVEPWTCMEASVLREVHERAKMC